MWGEWEEWKECTRSCGRGEKRRNRDKLIYAKNGGKDCVGKNYQQRDCGNQDCPGMYLIDFTKNLFYSNSISKLTFQLFVFVF